MNSDKILKLAKGFRGRSKNCINLATARVEKALQYAYTSRKLKKRDFRSLWIQQINAGSRQYELPYRDLAHGLVLSDVSINRKVLAELAVNEPYSFRALTKLAK